MIVFGCRLSKHRAIGTSLSNIFWQSDCLPAKELANTTRARRRESASVKKSYRIAKAASDIFIVQQIVHKSMVLLIALSWPQIYIFF